MRLTSSHVALLPDGDIGLGLTSHEGAPVARLYLRFANAEVSRAFVQQLPTPNPNPDPDPDPDPNPNPNPDPNRAERTVAQQCRHREARRCERGEPEYVGNAQHRQARTEQPSRVETHARRPTAAGEALRDAGGADLVRARARARVRARARARARVRARARATGRGRARVEPSNCGATGVMARAR